MQDYFFIKKVLRLQPKPNLISKGMHHIITSICEVAVIATRPFHAPSSSVFKMKKKVYHYKKKLKKITSILKMSPQSSPPPAGVVVVVGTFVGGAVFVVVLGVVLVVVLFVVVSWPPRRHGPQIIHILRKLYLNHRQDARHHQSQHRSDPVGCPQSESEGDIVGDIMVMFSSVYLEANVNLIPNVKVCIPLKILHSPVYL